MTNLSNSHLSGGLPRRHRSMTRTAVVAATCLALAAASAAIGFLSVGYTGINTGPGETGLAAMALLRLGTIADPYAVPTGPTAHVSPLMTLVMAAVFGLFDGNTPAARGALSLIAAGAYASCVALGARITTQLHPSRRSATATVLLACVVPIYLPEIVVYTRQYDQPLAAVALLCQMLIWANPGPALNRPYRAEAALAAVTGVGILLSPALLPVGLVGGASLVWTRREQQSMLAASMVFATVLGALMVPWAVRNWLVFDQFVLTRSNFALELVMGNGPGADGFYHDPLELHPNPHVPSAQHLAQIGELAFMREMGTLARAWILDNPARFMLLCLRRAWLLLFPNNEVVSWSPIIAPLRLPAFWLLGVLKLLALAYVVLRRDRAMFWLTCTLLPVAPYVLTHVNSRYTYVVFFPTLCLIGYVATAVFSVPRTLRIPVGTRNALGS